MVERSSRTIIPITGPPSARRTICARRHSTTCGRSSAVLPSGERLAGDRRRRRHRRALRSGRRSTSANPRRRAVPPPCRLRPGRRPRRAADRGPRRAAASLPRRGSRPAIYAEGDADLDLLADVLAAGKPSRLYRRSSTSGGSPPSGAYQSSRELAASSRSSRRPYPASASTLIEHAIHANWPRPCCEGPAGRTGAGTGADRNGFRVAAPARGRFRRQVG